MEDSTAYCGSDVSRGNIIPLISSYVAGPLGLMHLPRLWLKGLLHAADILAEDWGCGPGGLDKRIMDAVGIDGSVFMPWLLQAFPTYEACEAWVVEHACRLSPDSIARSNGDLASAPLPRGLGPQFRRYLKIEDDVNPIEVGIMLNNLDDWMAIHRYLSEWRDGLDPVVPAISPSTSGPLGIVHIPRLWLKGVLAAVAALPAGYARVREAADSSVLDMLGIDSGESELLLTGMPTYVQYEAWIRERLPKDAGTAISAANCTLTRAETQAAEALDWGLLHQMIGERYRAAPKKPAASLIGIRPFKMPLASAARAGNGEDGASRNIS